MTSNLLNSCSQHVFFSLFNFAPEKKRKRNNQLICYSNKATAQIASNCTEHLIVAQRNRVLVIFNQYCWKFLSIRSLFCVLIHINYHRKRCSTWCLRQFNCGWSFVDDSRIMFYLRSKSFSSFSSKWTYSIAIVALESIEKHRFQTLKFKRLLRKYGFFWARQNNSFIQKSNSMRANLKSNATSIIIYDK